MIEVGQELRFPGDGFVKVTALPYREMVQVELSDGRRTSLGIDFVEQFLERRVMLPPGYRPGADASLVPPGIHVSPLKVEHELELQRRRQRFEAVLHFVISHPTWSFDESIANADLLLKKLDPK